MKKGLRPIVFDEDLCIEAYRLEGYVDAFPVHCHDFYVFGFVYGGQRVLVCKQKEFVLSKGDIVIFNPGDLHSCSHFGEEGLDYRAFNVSAEVFEKYVFELTGQKALPAFFENVIRNEVLRDNMEILHGMVMAGQKDFGKEERFMLFIESLLEKYRVSGVLPVAECRKEIQKAADFMEENYSNQILLDELCNIAGLSKSSLLRGFVREKGVTPYSFLENIRLKKAKLLLESGTPSVEAAVMTGFSDQSHFTRFFSRYTGITPGSYREIFLQKVEQQL